MKRLRCVVFASSLKHGGRCIVAKDFDSKKWFSITTRNFWRVVNRKNFYKEEYLK